MKQKIYSTIFLTVFFSLVGVSAVSADTISTLVSEETADVTVEILTPDGKILDKTLTVTPCPVLPESATTTLSAKCALEQAADMELSWSVYDEDMFLDSIGSYTPDFTRGLWWSLYYNQAYGSLGFNKQQISDGDLITLTYGVNPLKIEMTTSTYETHATATIHIFELVFDNYSAVWQPATNVSFSIDDNELHIDEDGTVEFTHDVAGAIELHIQKEGFVLSGNNPTITFVDNENVQETTSETRTGIENHIVVRYINESIIDDTIYTTSTYFMDTSGNTFESPTTTALGVLTNALRLNNIDVAIINSWTYYISSIDGHTASGFDGWVYTVNQMDEYSGINDKILNDGDSLEVFYSVWPWRISTNATSTIVENDIVFTAEEYDASSTTWGPAATTTISINGDLYETDGQGSIIFTPTVATTTIAYIYSGSEDYPQNSAKVELPVYEEVQEDPAPSGGSGSGGCGSCGSNSTSNVDTTVKNIITFLDANQNPDGSFSSSVSFSDWTALAYNAYTGSATGKEKLKTYLLTNPSPIDGPNETTAYARRAMALMSYGINPYSGTDTNYIQKILDGFDGTQFGVEGLINDDVFALIPLLKAGYTSSDPIIVSTTKYILDAQNGNGGFGTVDITGAAMQALAQVTSVAGIPEALEKAKTYITNAQANDGGFGNVYGSAWAMQGLAANNVDIATLKKNGKSSIDYMISQQDSTNGAITYNENATIPNNIWASASAVPALLEKPWYSLLSSFSIPQSVPPSSGGGSMTTENTTTSTPDTTTQETSTTTEALADETPSENTSEVTILPISYETPEATLYAIGEGIVEQTLEPEVAGVKITSETTPAEESAEQASENTKERVEQLVSEETTATADTNAPEKNGAKPVHYAFGATIFLGLFLGWRFLRTLV